jgi:C-terminal processing protease CtpA/Prc
MLRRYIVVFDFPHQQVIFTPSSRFRLFDQEDKSGLTLVAKGADLKRFEVEQVQPGSPGAEAGIQKGDVIAGIDDEPAADMTLASFRELFRQITHKYRVLVERNDKTIEVSLQLRHRI